MEAFLQFIKSLGSRFAIALFLLGFFRVVVASEIKARKRF